MDNVNILFICRVSTAAYKRCRMLTRIFVKQRERERERESIISQLSYFHLDSTLDGSQQIQIPVSSSNGMWYEVLVQVIIIWCIGALEGAIRWGAGVGDLLEAIGNRKT